VKVALQRMGFNPRDEAHAFFSLVRFDAETGPCVLILDGWSDTITEGELARYLGGAGVDLALFWNKFDEAKREAAQRYPDHP
jgi:hypothetical protein